MDGVFDFHPRINFVVNGIVRRRAHQDLHLRCNCVRNSRKKYPTSVTKDVDCQVPRSESLVTEDGFISTQTVRRPAGNRLPTATECSVVASISTKSTPCRCLRISR